jgi:hypothetical protein
MFNLPIDFSQSTMESLSKAMKDENRIQMNSTGRNADYPSPEGHVTSAILGNPVVTIEASTKQQTSPFRLSLLGPLRSFDKADVFHRPRFLTPDYVCTCGSSIVYQHVLIFGEKKLRGWRSHATIK